MRRGVYCGAVGWIDTRRDRAPGRRPRGGHPHLHRRARTHHPRRRRRHRRRLRSGARVGRDVPQGAPLCCALADASEPDAVAGTTTTRACPYDDPLGQRCARRRSGRRASRRWTTDCSRATACSRPCACTAACRSCGTATSIGSPGPRPRSGSRSPSREPPHCGRRGDRGQRARRRAGCGSPSPAVRRRSAPSAATTPRPSSSPSGRLRAWPETERVVVVPWTRNERGATAGLKTISYAENVRALAYAHERGANEAVFANTRDELCEATGSNVFVVQDGVVRTPPESAGCLAGVTPRLRARALRARAASRARRSTCRCDALTAADEAFLTSSTRRGAGHRRRSTVAALPVAPGPVTATACATRSARASPRKSRPSAAESQVHDVAHRDGVLAAVVVADDERPVVGERPSPPLRGDDRRAARCAPDGRGSPSGRARRGGSAPRSSSRPASAPRKADQKRVAIDGAGRPRAPPPSPDAASSRERRLQ